MKQFIATITSKGQVTIPVKVRQYLGLKDSDKVVFVVEEEGNVLLTVPRYPTVASLRGAAGSLEEPASWHQMRATAREDHIEAGQGKSAQ